MDMFMLNPLTKKTSLKISKPRVAIFSDLHLGVHSNSSDWHNYAIEWAHWFKEECKRKNICKNNIT